MKTVFLSLYVVSGLRYTFNLWTLLFFSFNVKA